MLSKFQVVLGILIHEYLKKFLAKHAMLSHPSNSMSVMYYRTYPHYRSLVVTMKRI